jgi:hypothetical protein
MFEKSNEFSEVVDHSKPPLVAVTLQHNIAENTPNNNGNIKSNSNTSFSPSSLPRKSSNVNKSNIDSKSNSNFNNFFQTKNENKNEIVLGSSSSSFVETGEELQSYRNKEKNCNNIYNNKKLLNSNPQTNANSVQKIVRLDQEGVMLHQTKHSNKKRVKNALISEVQDKPSRKQNTMKCFEKSSTENQAMLHRSHNLAKKKKHSHYFVEEDFEDEEIEELRQLKKGTRTYIKKLVRKQKLFLVFLLNL